MFKNCFHNILSCYYYSDMQSPKKYYITYTQNPTPALFFSRELEQILHNEYIIYVLGITVQFIKDDNKPNHYTIILYNTQQEVKFDNDTKYNMSFYYCNFQFKNSGNIIMIGNTIKHKKHTQVANQTPSSSRTITMATNNLDTSRKDICTPNKEKEYTIEYIFNHDDIFLKTIFIKNIKEYSNIIKNNSVSQYSYNYECDGCFENKVCLDTTDNKKKCVNCIVSFN